MTWLEIGDASIWIYSCILQPDVYDRGVSSTGILQKYELCKMNFHLLNIWNFLCVGAVTTWTELNCGDLSVAVHMYFVDSLALTTAEIWPVHVYMYRNIMCTFILKRYELCMCIVMTWAVQQHLYMYTSVMQTIHIVYCRDVSCTPPTWLSCFPSSDRGCKITLEVSR